MGLCKGAITLDLLGHRTGADAPVVIDIPLSGDATTGVTGIVEVLFYESGVIGGQKGDVAKIRDALLKAAPESDFSAI